MSVLRSGLPTVTPLVSSPSASVWTRTLVSVELHSPKTSSMCLTLEAVEIEFEMHLSSTVWDGPPSREGSAGTQASLLLECERLVSSSSLGEEEVEKAPRVSSLAEEEASVPSAAPSPSGTAETQLLTGAEILPVDTEGPAILPVGIEELVILSVGIEERSVKTLVEVEAGADSAGQVIPQG